MPRTREFDENEVLEKAVDLFWKQGYNATSIQELVEALGINRASMYATFGDKRQLFLMAFESYRQKNIQQLKTFFEDQPNVKQGFHVLFDRAILEGETDCDRKGCFAVNASIELIPADEELTKIVEINKRELLKVFEGYLNWGKEQGQVKKEIDAKAFSLLLYSIYNGLRVISKVDPNDRTLYASIDMALSLLD